MLICSRTVLQKHSCSTYILLLAAANFNSVPLRREPFSAVMLPRRSSMPFSNHLSCGALNSTLEIQLSGLGFFCQCFVLLKQVWWRFCPLKLSGFAMAFPSQTSQMLSTLCDALWFFSPSTCNAFLYRIVSSDITAVLARTPAYSIFPPSHVSRM